MATFITDPTKVLSSDNIEQVTTKPTFLQEQKNSIWDKYGVNQYQQDADTSYAGLMNFDQGSDEMYQNNKQRKVSVNKANGIWRDVADQRSLERSGMARQADVINKNLNTALSQATGEYQTVEQAYNTNMQYMMQYPDADIDVDDSLKTVQKKIAKYESKAERSDLEDLYMETFGVKPKGLSKGEMRDALAKAGYDKKQAQNAPKASSGPGKGKSNATYAVNQAEQALGVKAEENWGAVADWLEDNDYDLTSGGDIDVELRRRNGLAPDWQVKPQKKGVDENGEDIIVDENTGERIYWVE